MTDEWHMEGQCDTTGVLDKVHWRHDSQGTGEVHGLGARAGLGNRAQWDTEDMCARCNVVWMNEQSVLMLEGGDMMHGQQETCPLGQTMRER